MPFNVEDFLTQHEYLVKVTLVDDSYLRVNYLGECKTDYIVYDDDHTGVIYQDTTGEDGEAIDLPRPVLRLYVLCDIYRQCRTLGVSNSVVRFYNKDGAATDLVSLLPIELDEDEAKAERLLQKYVEACYTNMEKADKMLTTLAKEQILHQALLLKGLIV